MSIASVPMVGLDPIAKYYSERAAAYGATPLGVDWSCVATQQMRFVQLLKGCDLSRPVSLNDLGCGYGALRCFIGRDANVDYLGIDVSAAMVQLARSELTGFPGSAAVVGSSCPRIADYGVASGIFNVRLAHELEDWTTMIEATLQDLVATSRHGVAVNFLAARPGPEVAGLYRATPERWIAYCREALGATVDMVAGYGMDEFTLLLR